MGIVETNQMLEESKDPKDEEILLLKKEIERLREIERVARTHLIFDRCSCGLLKRSGYLCVNNECNEI